MSKVVAFDDATSGNALDKESSILLDEPGTSNEYIRSLSYLNPARAPHASNNAPYKKTR